MTGKNIKFFVLIALLTLTAGIAFLFRDFGAESTGETTFFAMDTYMSVKAMGRNAEAVVELVKEEILRLDKELSVTNFEGIVYRLNELGSCMANTDMIFLLDRSEEVRELTDGAFNICIYPIMKEWGFTGDGFKVPDEAVLKSLCDNLNAAQISFTEAGKPVTLSSGSMVDFGGIAKGYASKMAGDIFASKKIKSALINLGGNVYAIGKKPDGSLWNIAVKSPDDTRSYLGVLSLSDKAVITSGGYERYFEKEGVVYHHVIDPSTGYPARSGAQSVTIISEDPTLADALSTALFVMGLDKATDLWRSNNALFDFIFYNEKGNLYVTEGVKDVFSSDIAFEVIEK